MTGRLRALAVTVAAALALLVPVGAAAAPPPEDLPAASWILIDAESGDLLAERAANEARPIASATKLMTAYLALRELNPAKSVVAPAYAAGPAESLMGLRAGESVTVHDLLYGALLPSGNDAAAALADAVSGSQPAFVELMNRTAGRLGLDDTSYGDPIGLDPGSASSAADLVRLTLRLREDPLFRKIVDTEQKTLRGGEVTRTVTNRNTLVLEYPWASGVKTGRTIEAGYVLVASGERHGASLVSAVLGAPTEEARDTASLELLRFGGSLYERRTPVSDGERLGSAAIRFSDERVAVVALGGVSITSRDDQDVDVAVDLPAEVEGPIRRGERLGTATVRVDGELAGRAPVAAAHAVEAATFFDRADSAVPGGRAVLWAAAVGALLVVGFVGRAVMTRARPR